MAHINSDSNNRHVRHVSSRSSGVKGFFGKASKSLFSVKPAIMGAVH